MSRARILALAGATMLIGTATFAALSTATLAADLPPPLPAPIYRPPVVVEASGWYLRGDVGVGMHRFKEFQFTQTNAASGAVWPASWQIDQRHVDDAVFVGGGIGYQWNNWFRVDFTGEYRTSVKFKAVGSFAGAADFCPGGRCFDVYDGSHQASVFLANFYLDLGTWWCLTPFVGFGVGSAYHKTQALSDFGINAGGGAAFGHTREDLAEWQFAWAAHAGVAYSVTNNFKVEFAYRYLHFGDVKTSEVLCGAAGCGVVGGGPRAFYTLTNFDSHDFKLGMRWLLQPEPPPPAFAPPLVRKG